MWPYVGVEPSTLRQNKRDIRCTAPAYYTNGVHAELHIRYTDGGREANGVHSRWETELVRRPFWWYVPYNCNGSEAYTSLV